MTREEIFRELGEIFKDVFDDETLEIEANMSADDIEDWDSLAQINLITAAERVFETRFSLKEISELKILGI